MHPVESSMVYGRFPSVVVPDVAGSDASAEELLAFERMLADLSARFANVPAEQVECEIQVAQTILRQFLGFDRSTFGEFQEDGSLVVLSSTALEGVEPTPQGPLPSQLSWFLAKLRTGEILVIQSPTYDLPPEAVAEAEYIQRTGLHSHLSIPLRIGGRIVGVIAFAAFKETRAWPEDLIARLKLVGEVFAHAIARKREHEKLMAAMAEIKVLVFLSARAAKLLAAGLGVALMSCIHYRALGWGIETETENRPCSGLYCRANRSFRPS